MPMPWAKLLIFCSSLRPRKIITNPNPKAINSAASVMPNNGIPPILPPLSKVLIPYLIHSTRQQQTGWLQETVAVPKQSKLPSAF